MGIKTTVYLKYEPNRIGNSVVNEELHNYCRS